METHISYLEYYQTRHNITITVKDQPLLVHRTKTRERRAGVPEQIHLIPELCYLTGGCWYKAGKLVWPCRKSQVDSTLSKALCDCHQNVPQDGKFDILDVPKKITNLNCTIALKTSLIHISNAL